MKIKLALVCMVLIGTFVLLENSLMKIHLGAGFATSAQDVSGKELFMASCSRCHGDNGEGGKGPNLTTAKKQAKWKDSNAMLVKKITKGGLIMPAFGKKLSAEQISAIASYVRTLPPSEPK